MLSFLMLMGFDLKLLTLFDFFRSLVQTERCQSLVKTKPSQENIFFILLNGSS